MVGVETYADFPFIKQKRVYFSSHFNFLFANHSFLPGYQVTCVHLSSSQQSSVSPFFPFSYQSLLFTLFANSSILPRFYVTCIFLSHLSSSYLLFLPFSLINPSLTSSLLILLFSPVILVVCLFVFRANQFHDTASNTESPTFEICPFQIIYQL